jgi:hypothetical protein
VHRPWQAAEPPPDRPAQASADQLHRFFAATSAHHLED